MTDSISETAAMIKLYRRCGEGRLTEDRVALFASKPAPTFEMHSNVGAGLLAKADSLAQQSSRLFA
ncbi:hypothetical protein CES87_22855 [Pseudomonas sp. ERMR1:02]|nr:hypothetical protein CES87_22855 [Pseudomonas sp. ERMR1:02]